jgi:hypothetical protein
MAAHLHIDNAKSDNSELSIWKTEEYRFIRVPQPPYLPDLAPSDFFWFGYLKLHLESKTFFDENNLKKDVRRILTEILVHLLHSVINEWARGLERCIELAEEYVS